MNEQERAEIIIEVIAVVAVDDPCWARGEILRRSMDLARARGLWSPDLDAECPGHPGRTIGYARFDWAYSHLAAEGWFLSVGRGLWMAA